MRTQHVCLAMALVSCLAAFRQVCAEPKESEKLGKRQIMLAVMNFQVKKADKSNLSEKIADLLTAFLSAEDGFQLVERAELKKMLDEMALGKSGIVKPEEAAKIGYMTGANVIVTGRAFVVGKKLFITGKVVSTETSRMAAVVAKGRLDQDLDEIVQILSDKVATFLREKGQKILPKIVTRKERIQRIKDKLADQKLPLFAVAICERHVGRATIDPAAQTEMQFLLKKCGAELVNVKDLNLSSWAKDYLAASSQKLPAGLEKADILIVGEGFSEFAGTNRKLISVKARVEIQAVDVRTGKILAVGRKTVTAVDLAEQIAGKTALQEAAADVAMKLIPETVAAFSKQKKGAAAE